jgi:hypothetical protein
MRSLKINDEGGGPATLHLFLSWIVDNEIAIDAGNFDCVAALQLPECMFEGAARLFGAAFRRQKAQLAKVIFAICTQN